MGALCGRKETVICISMGKARHLKAIDFFCGTGGMTYGLSQAGIKVLAGVDNDAECKLTYESNNPGAKFIHTDVHKFTEQDLIKATGIKRNDDQLVFIGCSPCQYWSKIHTDKKKSKESRNLLKEFQKFVEYFNPGFIVIENVPGLFKKKNFNALAGFLKFLDEAEYVYDNKIINANHYGVPQKRMRYLLLATRLTKNINLPKPLENYKEFVVQKFIGDKRIFPKIKAGHKDLSDFMHSASALAPQNLKRIKMTTKDGGDRSKWKHHPDLQINAYKERDDIFKDVYGRMYWERPAPTITTRFNSLSNGRFGHPEEHRAISLREGATLQTFPLYYKFYGSNNASISRQIGNAVPPELAKCIGKQLIKTFTLAHAATHQ